jgi:hypothetical protein
MAWRPLSALRFGLLPQFYERDGIPAFVLGPDV